MNTEEYEKHIQAEISPDLFIIPSTIEDRKAIMLKHPKGKKDIYVCGVPAGEVRDETDSTYQDREGRPFPCRNQIDTKIKNFLETLEADLELYED